MVQDQAEIIRARVHLNRAFTPGAPISHRDSLAGRGPEIGQIIDAVFSPGRNIVIFGERGVGKTSLAGLVHEFWQDASRDSGFISPRVNCEPLEDFPTIWSNIADEIESECAKQRTEITDPQIRSLLARLKDGEANANVVRRLFESWNIMLIPIIDEFDRLQDGDTIERFAETIKNLSDHAVESTIIIVGVADTIDELIEDHSSINRALVQIPLSRLTQDEIGELIRSRITQVGMVIDNNALNYIAMISQGLPYYGHLIGLTSGRAALEKRCMHVQFEDVVDGLREAVSSSAEVVQNAYYNATISARSDLYGAVLLACALAETDERGYFAPVDIRLPLSKIRKQHYEISRYLRHLGEFCEDTRGKILQKRGTERKLRYRFTDPLMKPFVMLHALQSGLLRPEEM